jgi:hypothetical protein
MHNNFLDFIAPTYAISKTRGKKHSYHNLLRDAVHDLQEQQLPVPLICTYGSSGGMNNIGFLATQTRKKKRTLKTYK